MTAAWLKVVPGGVEVAVYAQPRAARSRVVGEHDGMLKIQLAAPPVDGAANDALRELLSKLSGLPVRQVELIAGDTGRRKRVRLSGMDATTAERALQPT